MLLVFTAGLQCFSVSDLINQLFYLITLMLWILEMTEEANNLFSISNVLDFNSFLEGLLLPDAHVTQGRFFSKKGIETHPE